MGTAVGSGYAYPGANGFSGGLRRAGGDSSADDVPATGERRTSSSSERCDGGSTSASVPGQGSVTGSAVEASQAPAAEDPATNEAARRLFEGRLGYRFAKRLFDVVFSLLVFGLLWWVYLAVAIAVKVDDPSGPVFFRQPRVGKDGRRFTMWKFRSMYADAEGRFEALKVLNEKDGPVFKIKDDPRVTRVGRFIRKTSLDEMPQFWNVLRGDMSIVGPRPALPREVVQYTPRQRQRLLVRPGLTCYWQTRRNRDDISFDEWVGLDLLYVRQCSVWTDIKLIIQTIGVVLTAQGE